MILKRRKMRETFHTNLKRPYKWGWVKRRNGPILQKKDCPLRCNQKNPNSSVFFCKSFRSKSMDEKKALCKNTNLCILCLTCSTKNHFCPVQSCPRCHGHHNILFCPQEAIESAMLTKEDNDEDDSENELIEACTCNQDPESVLRVLSPTDDRYDLRDKNSQEQETQMILVTWMYSELLKG